MMVISKKILDNFNYVYMCVSMCISARVGAYGGTGSSELPIVNAGN